MKSIITCVVLAGAAFYMQGCASNTGGVHNVNHSSVGNVKDFQSAIRAYDTNKDIAYLQMADKYAVSDSEKAILERKMVDYMGIDNVFQVEVKVKNKGTQKGLNSAGAFSSSRASKQNISVYIKILPKPNLPFTLKYNTYKLSFLLHKVESFREDYSTEKRLENKKSKSLVFQTIVNLSSKNKWVYRKNIKDNVYVHKKIRGMLLHKHYDETLQSLEYIPKIKLIIDNTVLVDTTSNMQWQNFYPNTTNNAVYQAKIGSAYTSESYCKKLDLQGKGWFAPTLRQLKILSQNKVLVNNMKGTDLFYSDRYFNMYKDAVRLSDGTIKDQKFADISAIRCVRSRKYDPSTKLEWSDVISYGSKGDIESYARDCKDIGRGWRFPTPSEMSYLIKKSKIYFTDQPNSGTSVWTTSKTKSNLLSGGLYGNTYSLTNIVDQVGNIKSSVRGDNRPIYRCVRNK